MKKFNSIDGAYPLLKTPALPKGTFRYKYIVCVHVICTYNTHGYRVPIGVHLFMFVCSFVLCRTGFSNRNRTRGSTHTYIHTHMHSHVCAHVHRTAFGGLGRNVTLFASFFPSFFPPISNSLENIPLINKRFSRTKYYDHPQ